MSIWSEINRVFKRSSAKMKVVKLMLSYGLRIDSSGRIFCGELEIPYTSVARASSTDRRTVKKCVEEILRNNKLREFFEKLKPAGPFLKDVAKILGYRCLVIVPTRDQPGIIATITSILAKRKINIVQVIAEDPKLHEEPKLYIIVEGEIPGDAIMEILSEPYVDKVTVQ
ncbi:MAG: amino acid-binding protein [Thermoprotei archaeon]|nr:MAG: amino acid-binding protein [Thermoprotei archaeon]